MPFSVEKVKSRSQMDEFIELPYRLYRDDRYWVPPIKVQQKELF
ncbi:MAG: GTP cyclohydrolase, partial [Candidatus Aegiribacteria sp.]|nr:GTP cyclohydrolase [Candidatus Aegiribacteria sp.]MBD3294933.1 GTP cyclohydrolase [Candidatus Fermentibacteria bacterium]